MASNGGFSGYYNRVTQGSPRENMFGHSSGAQQVLVALRRSGNDDVFLFAVAMDHYKP